MLAEAGLAVSQTGIGATAQLPEVCLTLSARIGVSHTALTSERIVPSPMPL